MAKISMGKDLTKEAPRSPHTTLGGFAILARTIDKCRASLWGNLGEYHFDCPLDNQLFSFKGIKGVDFKAFVATSATDDEILAWVKTSGEAKTDADIKTWTEKVKKNNYSDMPEKKSWLEGENARLGIDKDTTLFDFLDVDDKISFKK